MNLLLFQRPFGALYLPHEISKLWFLYWPACVAGIGVVHSVTFSKPARERGDR